MARGGTFRAMFEPARYPAPPLDGLSTSWRYVVAGATYFFALILITTTFFVEADPSLLNAPTQANPDITVSTPPAPLPQLWPVWVRVLDPILGLIGLVIIRWRRRWPFRIYAITQVMALFSMSTGAVATWAMLSLASRRNLRLIGIAILFSTMLGPVMYLLPWQRNLMSSWDSLGPWGLPVYLVFVLTGNCLIMAIGMYYGVRQDRVAGVADRVVNADRDRELAVLGERNRIAREMHDVLAHRISLVSMHAGALAYRDDLTPEQTRAAAAVIQENAHASLTELRSVLSTLRDGQVDAAGIPVPPQPTLADLGVLLTAARTMGQRVDARVDVDPASVDAATSRHAYRIVQEALTNARKHAEHCVVALTLTGGPDEGLRIRVSNPLPPGSLQAGELGPAMRRPTAAVPGSGLGLVGVRERVQMLGGRLDAGVVGGEFVLDALLPWA